jgi:hypothetical protein
LLDTNALIWFLAAEFSEPEALVAVTQVRKTGSLCLSADRKPPRTENMGFLH